MTGVLGHVDLHVHSTASDGAFTPERAVEEAKMAGVGALALTDHDTLAGVRAAREAGERLGVRIVAGVELSTFDGDREVHLLGLHVALVAALEAELAVLRTARRSRAVQIVEAMNALGVPLTFDQVLQQSGDGAVGRPHIARAIIAGGWARDQREVFDRWLGAGRPANVEKRRLSVADGIRLIHAASGIAVVAHPGQDGRRELLEPLIAAGLDGIEVRHPGHGAEDIARVAALTDFFGLVPSGGSDCHGATSGSRAIGAMNVPAEWLDRQDALIASRAAAVA